MRVFKFKAFKIAFTLCLMTFMSPTVWTQDNLNANDRRPSQSHESVLYSSYSHLSPEKTVLWQQQTLALFEAHGLNVSKVETLSFSHWLSMWGMSNLVLLEPDFQSLTYKIRYWSQQLGLENLNEFIQRTTHGNAYHLLSINFERWLAMTEFMNASELFNPNLNSPRSLNWFLMTHFWAEGAVTSQKAQAELWQNWLALFQQVMPNTDSMESYFTTYFFEQRSNHDFLQRIYLSLSKDMYLAVQPFSELLSPEFLIDLIDPRHGYMHSGFSDDVHTTLEHLDQMVKTKRKLNGVLVTKTMVQGLLIDLLHLVYEDPAVLRNGIKFEKAVFEAHQSQNINMCINFLNKNF